VKISIIAAVSENGVIGRDGKLPWRLSADLKRFKALTMGHCLLMGRTTWESIGRPLPGRRILVLSRRRISKTEIPGVRFFGSFEDALNDNDCGEEIFIAGGAEVYRLTLPLAETLFLTRVHAVVHGDTFFPELDLSRWRCVRREDFPADEKNQYPFSFLHYKNIT